MIHRWTTFDAVDASMYREHREPGRYTVTPLYAAPQVPQPSGTEGERIVDGFPEYAEAIRRSWQEGYAAGLAAAPPAQPAAREDARACYICGKRKDEHVSPGAFCPPPAAAPVGEQDAEDEAWLERELVDLCAFAVAHHQDQHTWELAHALAVDIPCRIDAMLDRLRAARDAAPARERGQ